MYYFHIYIIVYTLFAIVYGGIEFRFCCCHWNMPVCADMLIDVIAYQDIAEVRGLTIAQYMKVEHSI